MDSFSQDAAKMVAEKRHARRVPCPRRVRVGLRNWWFFHTTSFDIGLGGMCLCVPIGLLPGERVMVGLCMPNNATFFLAGAVCHAQPGQVPVGHVIGVSWFDIDSVDSSLLKDFIDDLLGENWASPGDGEVTSRS
jgi:hypothetical protein